MKVRWLVISLLLVIVSAVAAVVFSSQGSEVSNGLSKGILYRLLEFFGIEITAESVKLGNFSHPKSRPFYGLLCFRIGSGGSLSLSKESPRLGPGYPSGRGFRRLR